MLPVESVKTVRIVRTVEVSTSRPEVGLWATRRQAMAPYDQASAVRIAGVRPSDLEGRVEQHRRDADGDQQAQGQAAHHRAERGGVRAGCSTGDGGYDDRCGHC